MSFPDILIFFLKLLNFFFVICFICMNGLMLLSLLLCEVVAKVDLSNVCIDKIWESLTGSGNREKQVLHLKHQSVFVFILEISSNKYVEFNSSWIIYRIGFFKCTLNKIRNFLSRKVIKKTLWLLFWIVFKCLKDSEPLRPGSLLLTTKTLGIPGFHCMDFGRMKGFIFIFESGIPRLPNR